MGKKSNTQKMNIKYNSHLTEIVDCNESFDKGIMRIAYTGLNRNNSFISKQTFEKCLKTLTYVPVVANYNLDKNIIGSHDSEYVENENGEMQEYSLTTPLGLVPENFNWFWEEVQESDGKIHEYLCCEVLLWKRQPVYEHIKKNGITDQSMELMCNTGEFINGYYNITDFTFTALCLLESAEPCFESASLHTYSSNDFTSQYSQMFEEFKICFASQSSIEDKNKNTKERKNESMDKLEIIKTYGFNAESLNFNYEEFEVDELTAKLEELKLAKADLNIEHKSIEEYALSSQFTESLYEAIAIEKIETEYGIYSRYSMVDFDNETSEVYVYDRGDYKLYGFTYNVSGDVVAVDFETKKKKKFAIIDFIDNENSKEFSLESFTQEIINSAINKTEEKFTEAQSKLNIVISEQESSKEYYSSLEAFKLEYDKSQKELIVNSEKYSVLSDNEAFIKLKSDLDNYSISDIERECKILFADHVLSIGEFSLETESKPNKLNIEIAPSQEKKPYNGYFDKYLNTKK